MDQWPDIHIVIAILIVAEREAAQQGCRLTDAKTVDLEHRQLIE